MPNKKISQLSTGSTLDGSELVPIVQSGVTKKVTTQDIADLGGSGSGVQSVTGNQVDNTDPLNPVVILQNVLLSPDEITTIYAFDNQASIISSDGVDSSSLTVQPDSIQLISASVTINSVNVATVNDIPSIAGLAPIASPTFTGTATTPAIIVSSETASRVAIIDASKNVKSADTATYPTLTELATVKGVTSAIQTQLNTKVGVVAKDIATSSALTGTTAITLVRSILIPANTFTTGDVCQIIHRGIRSTASGTGTNYIYINTSASLSGATLVGTQAAASRFYSMERNLFIKSSTVSETYDVSGSASGDNPAVLANDKADLNINWTVDQYVIHAFSLAAVGNSFVSSGIIVTKI